MVPGGASQYRQTWKCDLRYRTLIRNHSRALAFGFIHAFCSGPGQTFCISLFVASFATSFQTSPAELGSLYLLATLAAALALSQVGAWIDRVNLHLYSMAASALLASACLVTAAAPNLFVLTMGLFALRLAGQGLMSHVQTTATARVFSDERGTALALTGLGIPLAAAVFPPVSAFLIATMGWRWTYATIGMGVLMLLVPATSWLSPDAAHCRVRKHNDDDNESRDHSHPARSSASRALVTSGYFWAAIPTLVLVPFVSTAIVFQLTVIAAHRDWSSAWVGGAFPLMALAHVAALFASGRIIDAYSGRRLAVLHGIPITVSVLLLATFEHPIVLMIAMIGLGLSGAAAQTAFSAVWAEIYGLQHFGGIRSLVMSLMVVASAVAPLTLGLALSLAPNISIALIGLASFAIALQIPLLGLETARAFARKRDESDPDYRG